MRRGDIALVALDPRVGHEQGKIRPAVIVSNNAANRVAEGDPDAVITVVPITSNVARVLSYQVRVAAGTGLVRDGKVQAEQVRSLAARRIVRILGTVDAETLAALDEALRIHLDL